MSNIQYKSRVQLSNAFLGNHANAIFNSCKFYCTDNTSMKCISIKHAVYLY